MNIYPHDMTRYDAFPPVTQWPVATQITLNNHKDGAQNPLHDDTGCGDVCAHLTALHIADHAVETNDGNT